MTGSTTLRAESVIQLPLAMLRALRLLLVLGLLGLAGLFGAMNAEPVGVNLAGLVVGMPLGVALLLAAAAGAAIAGLLLWSARVRQLKRALKLKRTSG